MEEGISNVPAEIQSEVASRVLVSVRRCQCSGGVPIVRARGVSRPVRMSEYRVRFEVFEGPLDLLLHLVRKEEVDIYEVNLTKIATEFIDYLNLMRELDLDIAGEFVVMAATLMLIKSRELLPRDQRPEGQGAEEDEAEDPRWELIRQLVEYRKFKDAAGRLQEFEHRAENTYPRMPGRVELPEEGESRRSDASIFDLLSAVNAVMKRFADRAGEARDVFEERWTVSEKIELLMATVRDRTRVLFSELFHASTSRSEVVCTFLAVLELMRLRVIVAAQSEPFADIFIETAPPRTETPASTPPDAATPPATSLPPAGENSETPSVIEPPPASPEHDPSAPPSPENPGPEDLTESRWN